MPNLCMAAVTENKKLTESIFALKLTADDIVKNAAPGQFVHIKCGDANLLRRPISICDARNGLLTLVVEMRGEGTRWLTGRREGDVLDIIGPMGRGFDLSGKNIILVGGGIGVPTMLYTARSHAGRAAAVLGFRNKDCIILKDELEKACKEVVITTDDGSIGEHGTVSLPLERLLRTGEYDSVLACGPRAMLKAVAALAEAYNAPCQVSMEERMGCGIGACLVCACKTIKDGKEEMRHVCKDGPVFRASEVVW